MGRLSSYNNVSIFTFNSLPGKGFLSAGFTCLQSAMPHGGPATTSHYLSTNSYAPAPYYETLTVYVKGTQSPDPCDAFVSEPYELTS
jgi:hypothetical protein